MRLFNIVLAFMFAILAISFAVSNRDIVPVSLWPLPFEWPMPVAMVGFLALLVGFILGGIAAWIGAGTSRSRARAAERKTREQAREISKLEEVAHKQDASENASIPADKKPALPDGN